MAASVKHVALEGEERGRLECRLCVLFNFNTQICGFRIVLSSKVTSELCGSLNLRVSTYAAVKLALVPTLVFSILRHVHIDETVANFRGRQTSTTHDTFYDHSPHSFPSIKSFCCAENARGHRPNWEVTWVLVVNRQKRLSTFLPVSSQQAQQPHKRTAAAPSSSPLLTHIP